MDAIDWFRGRVGLFDPAGFLGVYGLHFFFIAPLLHMLSGYWMLYQTPPDDKREWLGLMACLNILGIAAYHFGKLWSGRRLSRRRNAMVWKLNVTQLRVVLPCLLLLTFIMQTLIYLYFGGILGYMSAYSDFEHNSESFRGFGWIFMISESFPILAIMGYAAYVKYSGNTPSWKTILLVIVVFFTLKIFFGGLRGSRANYIWPLFCAIGIIHNWVRPVSRYVCVFGVIGLIFFMFFYGLYKNFGTDVAFAIEESDLRSRMIDDPDRNLFGTILGDLGRSDVQAQVLYRLSPPSYDFEFAMGRTYLGAVSLVVPSALWSDRPDTKWKEGTVLLFSRSAWLSKEILATYGYGIAGEAMLNFGPISVPFVYGILGFIVIGIRRWSQSLEPEDARKLVEPLIVSLSLNLLVWDSDVIVFYIITNGFVPMAFLYSCSSRFVAR